MTIAVCLKVEDGLVLAADSASSLSGSEGLIHNVFNNANKIVNLRKGLPIGMMFWGGGSIGRSSMTTIAKDLRQVLTTGPSALDPVAYEIGDVAERASRFFYDDRWVPAYQYDDERERHAFGFVVAGYSPGRELAETYEVTVDEEGACSGPVLVQPEDESGSLWRGQPEAIQRLMLGISPRALSVLLDTFGLDEEAAGNAFGAFRDQLEVSLLHPAMPIQDVIDMGEWLVEISKQWSRFIPGAATVGGPTEVAAITKHEGFKWVQRKLYYDARLNPEG